MSVPHIQTFHDVIRSMIHLIRLVNLYLVSLMCWITRCYHHIFMINSCLMIMMKMCVPNLPMFPHWDCGMLHTLHGSCDNNSFIADTLLSTHEYARFIVVDDKTKHFMLFGHLYANSQPIFHCAWYITLTHVIIVDKCTSHSNIFTMWYGEWYTEFV